MALPSRPPVWRMHTTRMVGHAVPPAAPMTEDDLQAAVLDAARLCGWRVAHFRAARTATGWRTPVAADGQGFPDLVLARDRVMFVELKGTSGRFGAGQAEWAHALQAAGAEVHLWRPQDWPDVVMSVLRS